MDGSVSLSQTGEEQTTSIHAFTGCEVVSTLCGKWKKTAWQTWDICDEASAISNKLIQYSKTFGLDDFKILKVRGSDV